MRAGITDSTIVFPAPAGMNRSIGAGPRAYPVFPAPTWRTVAVSRRRGRLRYEFSAPAEMSLRAYLGPSCHRKSALIRFLASLGLRGALFYGGPVGPLATRSREPGQARKGAAAAVAACAGVRLAGTASLSPTMPGGVSGC